MERETSHSPDLELNQQSWELTIQIFDAALEMPAPERDDFMRKAAGGDFKVYSAVRRLIDGHDRAGDFLEVPAKPAGVFEHTDQSSLPIQPGQTIAERYRILRLVGQGGMGHVFEAWDVVLKRHVALKTIHPEIANHQESQNRFRREVSVALKITHPNVCRTFDIGKGRYFPDPSDVTCMDPSGQEVLFLTMEFLEGETLASRIAREGAQPLQEALPIARQVASALVAAHALGIVHRDIKPGNIMLAPLRTPDAISAPPAALEGSFNFSSAEHIHATVTDFGLAREQSILPAESQFSVTNTSVPLGTLAYMAPEQLENRSVTAASDVYAFGLVLFELATGKRAFPANNPLLELKQRLDGPPPSPRDVRPDLPQSWCRAIEGCLVVNPKDRFQSTIQAIDILEGRRTSRQIAKRGRRSDFGLIIKSFASSNSSIHNSLIALAITALVAVSLLLGGLRLYQSKTTNSKVDRGALVYLTEVKNLTGEKELDNLNGLLQAGLAQSPQINLLDRSLVENALERMTRTPDTPIEPPLAREIAMRTGAVRVIFAEISGSAGRYELKIDIQQPDTMSPLQIRKNWAESFPWTVSEPTKANHILSQELLRAFREASEWVRLKVGESHNDIARLDAPPEDVTTGNWAALSNYTFAEQLISSGNRQDAVSFLQKAIREDSDFALAYARLGDVLVTLNQTNQGYRAYLKALNDSEMNRLSLKERNRIKGIYAQDTYDFQASEDAFRESSLYYDHDYLAWFYRARPLSMLGRTKEAIVVLKRAHEVDPNRVSALVSLVEKNLLMENISEAQRWAQELKNIGQEDAFYRADGLIDFAAQDYYTAKKVFRTLERSQAPNFRAQGIRLSADLAAEQGDNRLAINQLNKAVDATPDDTSQLLDRAYLNGAAGDYDACAQDLEMALSKDTSPYTILVASEILGQMIPAAKGAKRKQLTATLDLLDRELPSEHFGTISEIARFRVRGEILLARGDSAGALINFRKSSTLEPPLVSHDYLGRALEEQAAKEKGSAANRLREEALAAYAPIALHPAVVWQFPLAYPPGFYSEQLLKWLRLAKTLGRKKEQIQPSLDAVIKLRSATTPIPAFGS